MASNRLTDNQIKVCIIPQHVSRWPDPGAGSVWAKAHDCVHQLHAFVRKVDLDCAEAEENEALSVDAIRRRRGEICDRAMLRLTKFGPFQIAQKAISDSINSLERLSDLDSEQAQMLETLKRALRDLEEGISATQRLLQERCRVRARASV